MGTMSIWHWIILLLIVVLLFGRGKISEVMTDVAKGIKSFKKGMSEDDDTAGSGTPQRGLDHQRPVDASKSEQSKV